MSTSLSSDTYLVEKLKEILLKLYPNQTKFPITSTTTTTTPPPSTSLISDIYSGKVEVDLQFETIVMRQNQNTSHQVTPGTDEQGLTQSLSEFIKILKMSLNTTPIERTASQINYQPRETRLPSVTMSNADIDFNLSVTDIADFNELMNDGQDMTLPLKHVVIIFFYLIIACVAIVGNLLVVQLVIRSRRLHTLTHVLLANLAVADLMMATINIPFSAARVILKEWPFGSFLCHIVPFVQVASVYVISYTMAVIALDRYQVIMNPLGRRLKSTEGIPLVGGIWILSILLSLPYAIHHKVVNVLTLGVVKRCQADFHSIKSRQWLTVGTFLLQYLIPLLLTTLSYFSIMRRLGRRSSVLGSTTPRQAEAQSRAKIRTIKMLVLTVICFGISWAPINSYHLLTHFGLLRHNSIAILVAHMIAMSSSCYNPYIYCWLNEHFRHEASRWSRCFRTRRSPLVHPGVEINGMLTRTDLMTRRHQSSTLVHTTSFRSQLLPQLTSIDPMSPRAFRPELIFLTTTTATSPSGSPPTHGDAEDELGSTLPRHVDMDESSLQRQRTTGGTQRLVTPNHPGNTLSTNGMSTLIERPKCVKGQSVSHYEDKYGDPV